MTFVGWGERSDCSRDGCCGISGRAVICSRCLWLCHSAQRAENAMPPCVCSLGQKLKPIKKNKKPPEKKLSSAPGARHLQLTMRGNPPGAVDFNQRVPGSSPGAPTTQSSETWMLAPASEMAAFAGISRCFFLGALRSPRTTVVSRALSARRSPATKIPFPAAD
jgi:hypothetical protein